MLTGLLLSKNHLTSVPAALGRLTALTTLTLTGNQLTSVPAELGGLAALTTLYLGWQLGGLRLTNVPAAWEKDGALEHNGCQIVREDQRRLAVN